MDKEKHKKSEGMNGPIPLYESFLATITALKQKANAAGVEYTDLEIANKLDIPMVLFEKYYKEDRATPEIFARLRQNFSNFLSSTSTYCRARAREEFNIPEPLPGDEQDSEEVSR
jgi:hypothetical protein